MLRYCTLTGIDETTDLATVWALAERYPFVEFGVLYSQSQQGQGRDPGTEWLRTLAGSLPASPARPRFALHVCGTAAVDQLIAGIGFAAELARPFDRIQVNFQSDRYPLAAVRALLARHSRQEIITQHNEANATLWQSLADAPNHAVLFDTSGGRGIERSDWPAPLPGVRCGYAGGLGPDQLAAQRERIRVAAGEVPFWIDMEGKLRDSDDRFDLARAQAVLSTVAHALSDLPAP